MSENNKVVVIGAGVCGLTAGYRLKQAGFEVSVLEALPYVGGRTRSIELGDCVIDAGATVLPGTYRESFELIRELGIEDQLDTVHGSFAVPRAGKMHLISLDRLFRSMLKTPLLGFAGKLAMLRVLARLLPVLRGHSFTSLASLQRADRETLAQFSARALPAETYDYLLNPMLKFLYIHNGESGSLIELLWWLNTMGVKPSKSFRRGMSTLAKALAAELDVRVDHRVVSIQRSGAGVDVQVQTPDGTRMMMADYCVVATPAPVTAAIGTAVMDIAQQQFMAGRVYEPCLVVCFCTSRRPDLDVIMVEVPDEVSRDLATIVFQHNIASGRASDDKGIVNAYFTGEWSRRLFEAGDSQVMEEARKIVRELVPEVDLIDGFHVQRWPYNASLSEVGACEKIARFEHSLSQQDRVIYIGDYLVQASVNVAVALGNRAAQSIADRGR